ncbi:MAG: hypothetical protein WCV86_00895 [Patescibacteria group bacterium]|jgi:hypothetical protein
MNDELVRHMRVVISHLLSDVATGVRQWERLFVTQLRAAEGNIDTSASDEGPSDPSNAEMARIGAEFEQKGAMPRSTRRDLLQIRASAMVSEVLREIPRPSRDIPPGDTAQRERFLRFRVLRVILITALTFILEDAETPPPTEGGSPEA